MIKGQTKTEANYRALNLDSSSSLKEFSLDRKKYFRKYILGEKVDDEENKAATMGRIVETLLLEPAEFDKRFYMSSCASAPTGLMLSFVEALYKATKEATDEETGKVNLPFDQLLESAYKESGFKIKLPAVLEKFTGSDAEVYYKEIREVRSKNLTVITTEEVTNAERIVEELKSNEFTANIVNLVNSPRYEVINQMQIEDYELYGMKFKSMIDKVIIDHEEKKIYIYDLKCVWAVENFYEEYYLYRRAYIQAFLYWHAVKKYKREKEMDDYLVEYPRFIVCDSMNYYNPLIYVVNQDDMDNAWAGFTHKGRNYPSVPSLIEDLKWALETNKWNISRNNYINKGLVNLS